MRSSREPTVELGRAARPCARDQPLERLLDLVRLLADRPALLRRQLADRAQRAGQLRLAPEVADPQLLELRGRRLRADRASPSARSCVQVRHGRPSYLRPRRAPRWPPSPRSATRVRPPQRDAGALVGVAHDLGRQPCSAPRQSTSGVASSAVDTCASGARREGRAPERPRARRGRAGRRAGEHRSHARPDGFRRERIGAARPEDHGTVAERLGGAEDRADVAGVLDAVQVDHHPPGVAKRCGRRRSRGCLSRGC